MKRDAVHIACLVLIVVAMAWRSLGFGFALDDYSWLEVGQRRDLSWHGLLRDGVAGFPRPVVSLSFDLMCALFGTEPLPQHVFNVALHVACTCLVYVLLRYLQMTPRACMVGALIFCTHPSHDEVIAWVSARTSSLMTNTSLMALIAWARWPHQAIPRVAVAIGCMSLSLLCKEDAIVLPVLFLAMDRLVHGMPMAAAVRRTFPAIALALAYAGMRAALSPAPDRTLDVSYAPARLCQGVLSRFPELFLPRKAMPVELLYGLVALGLALALWRTDARRRRMIGFGCALAAVTLLPSSVLSFAYTEDRYRYLPSVGSSLVWCCLCVARDSRNENWRPRLLALGVLLLVSLQSYRLVRDLRYWDHDRKHQVMTAAARVLSASLRTRLDQGHRLAIGNVPMVQPHIRSLLVVYAGVAPHEFVEAHAATLFLDWNPTAESYELRGA